MAQTPINKLISSWTDLSEEVNIEDLSRPSGSSPIVRWPLEQVKQRFSHNHRRPNQPPIVCQCLHTDNLPAVAWCANQARNNPTAILERSANDPNFLAYKVLGQATAILINRCKKFDSYTLVEEGRIMPVYSTKALSEEERVTVERDPSALSLQEYAPTSILLRPGDQLILPANRLYTVFFVQESLFTAGSIVSAS